MDRLRDAVRRQLGRTSLSMSQLLQDGSWFAGRTIAVRLRPPDGPPRLQSKLMGRCSSLADIGGCPHDIGFRR
jgi:hypothetical protein